MQREEVKNLFKHKIPFYSLKKECIKRYEFSTISGGLNIVYKTNTIKHPIELGISNFKDLMDKVNPFIYYLASKYQNVIEWNYEYEIFFDVGVAFPGEKYEAILIDYRLSKYHNDLSIDITEQNLYDFTEEDIEKLISTPFHIIISVYAEYNNRFYEDEDDEEEVEVEEVEEEDDEEVEPIELKQTIIYDKCVICLENKANILYPKCSHISTCKRCEELHPIFKCPICREKVMIKYII